MLANLQQLISASAIAVDLGTANTRLYAASYGKVTERPSALRLAHANEESITDEYISYLNNKISTRPLRVGVIVDLENAIALLKPLVKKSKRLFFFSHLVGKRTSRHDRE